MGVAYLTRKVESVYGALIPWTEPERYLRQSVDSDPMLAEGWYFLSRLAQRRGRLSEAAGDFRETLKLNPAHRKARLNLASTLLIQERASEAELLLRQALQTDPADLEAMSDLVRALLMLGEEEEAAALIAKAMVLGPDDPVLLANAGLLAARQGRHEEAESALRMALTLRPGHRDASAALRDLEAARSALTGRRMPEKTRGTSSDPS